MTTQPAPIDRKGLAAAIAAFVIWGVFPLYWALLKHVPAFEIVAHRIVWCTVFVVAWLCWDQGLGWLSRALRQPRAAWMLSLSSLLISVNWLLYIWAVNSGHVLESSLGYFINPLVNVLIGVAVLGERLRRAQWLAVALAAAGVLWLSLQQDRPPWIALGLAGSFALYGLIRKQVAVESIPGLGVESVLLFLPALAWLWWAEQAGGGAIFHGHWGTDALLITGGALTAVPLIAFAFGARRIPYSMLGILQYIGPSMQFLLGIFVFGEAFSSVQAIGFGLIWLALVVYAAEGWRQQRRRGMAVVPAS
ncbi:EamA family transporter RarD [Aquimonas sp.]|uniref:EamA family transporter RarD n=1 Tax=Aquimonas sp. TaxID=1872588 RepID=UPI0037C15492